MEFQTLSAVTQVSIVVCGFSFMCLVVWLFYRQMMESHR